MQTAGRDQLGNFAPDFARYNDDILFGEVWSANDKLSLHDRSLVTVTALIAQGLTDSSFQYHMATAKKNGVTREEMVQAITSWDSTPLAQSLGGLPVCQRSIWK